MDDNENYLEREQRIHRTAFGSEMSPDEIAKDFRLQSIEGRTATLLQIDDDLRQPIGSDNGELRRRVELFALRRKLGGVHTVLTKVNR